MAMSDRDLAFLVQLSSYHEAEAKANGHEADRLMVLNHTTYHPVVAREHQVKAHSHWRFVYGLESLISRGKE